VRRSNFERRVGTFETAVREKTRHDGESKTLGPTRERALARIVRHIEHSGRSVVLFEAPTLGPRVRPTTSVLRDVPLLSLSSAVRYPLLYERRHHFDGQHVNEAGAVLLSEALGHELAALPPPSPAHTR
jgi:hypothetical protein